MNGSLGFGLRFRRLGVRVSPSALDKTGSDLTEFLALRWGGLDLNE